MKKLLAAAFLAGGLIMATATAASAHHPIVSGETVCADDGQQTITWTVSNSESVTGTNRAMEIDQVSIDRGEVGFTIGQDFPPTPTAGSSQRSTTTYDGDETGDVTLKVQVDFAGDSAPKDVKGEATVTLVGECVAVTTTSTSTSTTSTSTSTSTSTTTTTTTQPPIVPPVPPVVAEQAVVVPTEVLGVQLTAPAPVGGVQTGGGGTSQSGSLLPLAVGLGVVSLIGLVGMQLRRPAVS